jgi:ribosomal protein S18 acetylase RimI-like enzyme
MPQQLVLSLRAIEPSDEAFLYRVYASTRTAEMELVNWSESDKQAFLWHQFTAQHTYYQQHYATASFQVVLCGDAMVGRLYVNRGPTEIRIVDISVLPEYRGHGVGTCLLRDILGEANRDGKEVTIHVERFNQALGWYQRLGFRPVEDRGVYVLMRWSADAQVNTAS